MFHAALLDQTDGTTGGWSGVDSPRSHPPGRLGSGEGQCLIDLVRVVDTEMVNDGVIVVSSLQLIPSPIF